MGIRKKKKAQRDDPKDRPTHPIVKVYKDSAKDLANNLVNAEQRRDVHLAAMQRFRDDGDEDSCAYQHARALENVHIIANMYKRLAELELKDFSSE